MGAVRGAAFLLVLYRYWGTWLHYAGAVVVSVVYPIMAWVTFDLGSLPLGLQIAFFTLIAASTLGATALGILIADRPRAAGVARVARRRPMVMEPAARPAVQPVE